MSKLDNVSSHEATAGSSEFDASPDDFKNAAEKVNQNIRRTYWLLIGTCLYSMVTLSHSDDIAFFSPSPTVKLPILSYDISYVSFLIFGTVICVSISIYLNTLIQYRDSEQFKMVRMVPDSLFDIPTMIGKLCKTMVLHYFPLLTLSGLIVKAWPYWEKWPNFEDWPSVDKWQFSSSITSNAWPSVQGWFNKTELGSNFFLLVESVFTNPQGLKLGHYLMIVLIGYIVYLFYMFAKKSFYSAVIQTALVIGLFAFLNISLQARALTISGYNTQNEKNTINALSIKDATFVNANITNVTFENSEFENITFINSNLDHVSIRNSRVNLHLVETHIKYSDFKDTNEIYLNMSNSSVKHSEFANINELVINAEKNSLIKWVTLTNSTINASTFHLTQLDEINFKNSKISGSSFDDSSIRFSAIDDSSIFGEGLHFITTDIWNIKGTAILPRESYHDLKNGCLTNIEIEAPDQQEEATENILMDNNISCFLSNQDDNESTRKPLSQSERRCNRDYFGLTRSTNSCVAQN